MLSNTNQALYRQQRQHRRQNSTPTAFEAPKVPLLPATKLRRLALHRRSQSLDQQAQQTQRLVQDESTVSITPGFQPNPQHTLRATQQHKLVQPGQQQKRFSFTAAQDFETQHPSDVDALSKQRSAYYPTQFYSQLVDGVNAANAQISGDRSGNSSNNGSTYLDQNATRPASYPGGLGLGLDGFPGFSGDGGNMGNLVLGMPLEDVDCNLGMGVVYQGWEDCQQRPTTPLKQIGSGKLYPQGLWVGEGFVTVETAYYPLTPTKTPHSRVPQTAPIRRKIEAMSPSLNTETIKASPRIHGHRRAQSTRDVFSSNRFRDDDGLPSPPNSAPLPAGVFDIAPIPHPSFMSMKSLNVDFNGSDNGYESSHYSPMSSALSPTLSSLRSSAEPEISRMPLFDNPMDSALDLVMSADAPSAPSSGHAANLAEQSQVGNPPSSPRAMSMSMPDLNIDAPIKDTGITIDDIASFIQGPDPLDGKWICLYPECNKRFGRKENIKSHIQTHLGDRQFICNYCQKCFVRQHDLKRHAKIHSGVKPYPCPCGNSFARHDALTRHRQRGMCIGAFEGAIKKPAKRGRPRKTRPDEEERLDKAARTKKAVAMSSTSSSSGFSDLSNPHSPPGSQDLGTGVSSPFNNLPGYLSNSNSSPGVSPEMFFHTPPASPNRELDNYVSPQRTQYSLSPAHRSPTLLPEGSMANASEEALTLPPNPPSPGQDFEDVYTTPPELSHLSSSPPPSAVSSKYDLGTFGERNSSQGSAEESRDRASSNSFTSPGINEGVDEMFGTSLTALERDPDILFMPEFDKLFSNNDMFQETCEGPDVFFGSP
jgi:regulatory protein SWI5